jgi:hypothetical protein
MRELMSPSAHIALCLWVGLASAAHAAEEAHAVPMSAVHEAGGVTFRVMSQRDELTVLLSENGKPLSTTGMSGRVVTVRGALSKQTSLVSDGGNGLISRGFDLPRAGQVTVVVKTAAGKTISFEFETR